jgi:adenylate cyclase
LAQVFLSYAREDVAQARELAEAIQRAGHEVWWDQHIQGGSRFAREIDAALKGADAVVVLWSETSVESAWVQDEAAEGRDRGCLVPALLGAVKPPLGFRQFQSVDVSAEGASGELRRVDQLVDAIVAVTRNAPPQNPAPLPEVSGTRRDVSAAIIVIPFTNMSGDPEQEYFSDGITEDIITDLSKISALSVVSRNTAFSYKGRSLRVREVAREVGVTHVIEGSVRKAGNRVRITAQLIDGGAGDQLWAERYDRELTDIFAIQDEISHAIVEALQIRLLPEEREAIERRGTDNVDAYNLYLMARQHWVSGAYGDPRRDEAVVRICQQATALDPGYAEAWALMALAQSELKIWRGMQADARASAERALSLKPDLAEPYCVKARAVEEDGDQAEANRLIEKALELSPESWEVNREAARMMFRQGNLVEAIRFFEKAASLMDSDWHNATMLKGCYAALGDREQLHRVARMTLERAQRAIARDPTNAACLIAGASSFAILGERERAEDWARRALIIDPENLDVRYNLACLTARDFRDHEGALDVLEPWFNFASKNRIKHLEADPDFSPLRGNQRFEGMIEDAKRRLGLIS